MHKIIICDKPWFCELNHMSNNDQLTLGPYFVNDKFGISTSIHLSK